MNGNHRAFLAYEADRSPRRWGWLFLAGAVLGMIFLAASMKPAGGQEWHCPWTSEPFSTPGWVGEWDGEQRTEIHWSSAPYYATEVCVRTASGITYTEISPATSGTISSDDPIVAYSLYKISEPPSTTTTTEAPTTSTTVVSTTSTTEGTTTTSVSVPTSTTSPGPVQSSAPPAPGPGEPVLADTGFGYGWLTVLALALLALGHLLTSAKRRAL